MTKCIRTVLAALAILGAVVFCTAGPSGVLSGGGRGVMPDSLMVRRALDAILAPAGADSASTKEDTVVVRDTFSVLTDSLVIMSAVKDTVIADSIDAAAAREDTIAEEYQLSQEMRDSLHKRDVAIKAAMEFLSGVQQPEVRVGEKGISDTLFAADSYQARIYDSLPEPTQPPYVNIGHPVRFTLNNGLKVIVYTDDTMPIVTFYIGILNRSVFEKDKKGVSDLTANMLLAGVQNRTKAQITDSLANMGSVFRMNRSSFYVSGLKKYARANFNLFADVVLRPSFPLQEFFTEKKAMKDAYTLDDSRPEVILNRVYRALALSGKVPTGEFISENSIDRISLNDCQEYYSTYWRPNNAVLLVMGDITADQARMMVNARFRTWASADIPKSKISVVNDLPATAINFIHDPSARDCRIIMSNIAEFDYNSPDVFPAMFINHLMGGDLLANIRATLQAGGYMGDQFSLSPDPLGGYMYLSTRTSNLNAVRTIAEKTAQLQRIRTVPLDEKELSDLKQYLTGKIALSFEDRNALGSYGVAMEDGTVKKDFLEDILKQINSVSAEDIMRVAQKYIKPSQFRIVMYGDARKVVPPLELAGYYNISFYDKYAVRVARPSLSQPITDSIAAIDVIGKYFEAMGGRHKMSSVKTLRQNYEIMIGDRTFKAQTLSSLPCNHQEQILYDGQVYLKKTFNGNMGYTKIENTTVNLSAEAVEKQRLDRSIFPLLDYQKKSFAAELDSIVPVNGHFTYRLRVTMPSGSLQNYYISMDDYMVLRIENVAAPAVKEFDEKGVLTKYVPEKIGSYSDFGNYKEVSGLKYPFSTEVKDADGGRIIWRTLSVDPNVSIPAKMFR